MHLSVNKYVHGDSVVHSMHLSALSSQQVFFGRDVGQTNSQTVADLVWSDQTLTYHYQPVGMLLISGLFFFLDCIKYGCRHHPWVSEEML